MSSNIAHATKIQDRSITSSKNNRSNRARRLPINYDSDTGIFKCVVSPNDPSSTALDNDWEAIVSQCIGVSLDVATFIIDHERDPDEAALFILAPYDLPWWAASVQGEKHVLQAWEDINSNAAACAGSGWFADKIRSQLSVHLGIIDRRVIRRHRNQRGLPPKFIDLWRPYVGDDD